MKLNIPYIASALSLAGLLIASSAGHAATVNTTTTAGDIFIGFRQTGAANSLVVNLGQATQFIPVSLGGTAAGSFNVKLGLIPTTNTAVYNINADLTSAFGAGWATNANDGTAVRVGFAGMTANLSNNSPIAGLNARSIFISQARIDPGVKTATPGNGLNENNFANPNYNGFVSGSLTGYANKVSTENSSAAYIGGATGADNWNTRIGANGSFGLGASTSLENTLSGPTDTVWDLYLSPFTGSTLVTSPTYLGYFTLNPLGELTYTTAEAVPEPSTAALLGLAGTALVIFRRRRSKSLTANA